MTNQGFSTIRQMISDNCSSCHSWTGSYREIADPSRIAAYDLKKSGLYQKVIKDIMPLSGPKLNRDQKNLLTAWILSGATASNIPLTDMALSNVLLEPDTQKKTLKSPGKATFHEISGFTSAGLLLAANTLGTIHLISMMDQGHAYRDSIGYSEDTGNNTLRSAAIKGIWSDPSQQNLRLWHVGLLTSGELLYLYNAMSGISMWSRDEPD
jgi:hypothetical protein